MIPGISLVSVSLGLLSSVLELSVRAAPPQPQGSTSSRYLVISTRDHAELDHIEKTAGNADIGFPRRSNRPG